MIDWTLGRTNRFEYEMVDPFDLESSWGFVEGVRSCTVTNGYYTDLKQSAAIELSGSNLERNALVRVWHIAEQAGAEHRSELGTFMPDTRRGEYRFGRVSGQASMYSTLYRLSTDKRITDMGVSTSQNVVGWIRQRVEGAGGTLWVDPDIDDARRFPEAWTFEYGKTLLYGVNQAASSIGCRIEPDAHGRVCLVRYQEPSARSVSLEIPSGAASVVRPGVSMEEREICNRAIVKYQSGDETVYGRADLPASHPWAFERIGAWHPNVYTESQLDDTSQAALDRRAAEYLALNSAVPEPLAGAGMRPSSWEIEMLYMPMRMGEIAACDYSDTDLGGIRIKGLVQQQEIRLDAAMLCKVILNAM